MSEEQQPEKQKVEKLFAVITVARQIEGEYVFIKTEKAFTKAGDADALLKKLKQQYVTQDGQSKPQTISTAQGAADCHCEVGAFELEVEGDLWVTNG
jgi:glyoxylate utilization-related uncharacterized protein